MVRMIRCSKAKSKGKSVENNTIDSDNINKLLIIINN